MYSYVCLRAFPVLRLFEKKYTTTAGISIQNTNDIVPSPHDDFSIHLYIDTKYMFQKPKYNVVDFLYNKKSFKPSKSYISAFWRFFIHMLTQKPNSFNPLTYAN